jgi:eukaryotic-like serine/threonine-protein kinase
MAAAADRHLLFGLLALQTGIINQGQLVAAFQAWTLDKMRSLADILVARGDVNAVQRGLLEGLADQHLQKHGDVEKSLAAVPANRSARARLAALGEPEIEATLARVARSENGETTDVDVDDPERTGTFSVGSATSDGQRFRVLRPHARGGLGAVFVALDGELHREVALKQILEKHADDPDSRHRFIAEAEITGGLEHPGVVPVYGLGTDAGGRPYYAMRFIKGISLKEAIERFHNDEARRNDPGRRSLELRRLLRRFTDVCNAIDFAHARGVIHRDLKPANIIVGEHGETLVVDWGLAKVVGRADPSVGEHTIAPSSSGSSETLPGSALGTPAYMSPEQARGELDRLGPRSDVYSLGATLYCLLAGKPPFEGEDVGEILRAVQEGRFPRPALLDPSPDKALEAICLKAMATQPEDRYSTPNALANDLDRWMADEPVMAWREPFSRRARRWARRNRTVVTAAAVALVAGVVGLSAVLAVQTRAKADLARSRAAVQTRYDLAVDAIETFHTGVSEDFLLKEEQFKDLRDRLLKSASDFYGKLGALLGKESDLASRRALWQANYEVAELAAKIGKGGDALTAHRQVLAARESLAAEPHSDPEIKADVARSLAAIAGLLDATGAFKEAEATYRKAETLLVELALTIAEAGAARAVLANCRSNLGRLLCRMGRYDEALSVYRLASADQEALAAGPGAKAEYQRDLASTIHGVAMLLAETSKPSEAEAEYRKALAIRQKLADDNPAVIGFRSSLAAGHNAVASMLSARNLPEAEAELRAALLIEQKLVDENPAVTDFRNSLARIRANLGGVLSNTSKSSEAEAEYRRALGIRQKLADDNPTVTGFRSGLAYIHNRLGWLLSNTGKSAEAEAEHLKALELMQKLADDNPAIPEFQRDLATSLLFLGWRLAQAGKTDDAIRYYTREEAIRQKVAQASSATPHDRDDLANCQTNTADVLRRSGRLDEALAACKRSLAVRAPLVETHPNVARFRARLGETYLRLGQVRCDMGDLAAAAGAWKIACANYDRSRALREGEPTFFRACCYAGLAGLAGRPGSGVSAAQGADQSEEAMAALREAVTMSFRDHTLYRAESALDPLRNRPDFQLLMMDLAFPAQPFEPPAQR